MVALDTAFCAHALSGPCIAIFVAFFPRQGIPQKPVYTAADIADISGLDTEVCGLLSAIIGGPDARR